MTHLMHNGRCQRCGVADPDPSSAQEWVTIGDDPTDCKSPQEPQETPSALKTEAETRRKHLMAFLSVWRANMAKRDPSANGVPLDLLFNVREVALVETLIAYMSETD